MKDQWEDERERADEEQDGGERVGRGSLSFHRETTRETRSRQAWEVVLGKRLDSRALGN